MVTWLDAQIGVIGSVLISPELAPRVVAETDAGDYSGDCLSVYRAVAALLADNRPVDAMTIRDRLGPASSDFLRRCMDQTPTAVNIDAYLTACREQARLSKLHSLAGSLTAAVSLDDARGIVERMSLLCAERSGIQRYTAAEAIQAFYERKQRAPRPYLDWGFPKLNDNIELPEGKYVIIGGRPSSGKTAFALQLAGHMGKAHRVGFYSYETDRDTLTERSVANIMQISYRKIRKNDLRLVDWQTVTRSGEGYSALGMDFIEASGMTVSDIMSDALAHRYDIVMVDYLQQITPTNPREMRTEQVSEISRNLQHIAQRHKITVIALSQFKRAEKLKGGTELPPTMEALRESGQIEQDADVIMLLYRLRPDDSASPRRLHIAKNKDGTTGRFDLDFDGDHQTFVQCKTTYQDINRAIADAKRAARAPLTDPEPDLPFEQAELPM